MNIPDCHIDVRSLVKSMGGVKELSRKLIQAGVEGSPQSIYKCMDRQSLTSSRLAAILLIAQAEKDRDINIYKYIRKHKTTEEPCKISPN